jgi:hypothetical protein
VRVEQSEEGDDGTKRYRKMNRSQRAHLDSMRRKRDTALWYGDIGWRRGVTKEGKSRRQRQWDWYESYWAEKLKKYMWLIQLLQIDSGDLK